VGWFLDADMVWGCFGKGRGLFFPSSTSDSDILSLRHNILNAARENMAL
jgi:hypothetical protein